MQLQLAISFENVCKSKLKNAVRPQLIPVSQYSNYDFLSERDFLFDFALFLSFQTLISIITNLRQLKISLVHQSFKLDQENSSQSDSSISGSVTSSPR